MTGIQDRSAFTRGVLICLAGTAIWSTTAIFIAHLSNHYRLPPLVLAFWRDLFVALGLALVLGLVRPSSLRIPHPRRDLVFFVAYGLTLAIFNALWTTSVAINGAAVATVLVYSSPAFTALVERRLFGERFGPARVVALILSLAGCVLASGAYDRDAWSVNPLGIAVGLSSGWAFTAYSLFGKAAHHRGISPWTATFGAFTMATAFLLLWQHRTTLFWLGPQVSGWVLLAILALVPTIGGYGLYTVSLASLPAAVANIIVTLEPVMTGMMAYFILGEQMTFVQFMGGGLILTGVFLLQGERR
ncbi:MAG: DMT family transporter [Anaerolineae bacterium]